MQAFRFEVALGSVLGGAIGDILGGITERGSLSISDDTQLTLATCEALSETGAATAEGVAERMLSWFREGRITGIGSSTLKAMRDLEAGAHWALSGARGERSAGNGAAMRIAPLAFFLDPANSTHRVTIRDVARITHHHEEAYAGALAVVIAVRSAASRQMLGPEAIAQHLPDTRVKDYLLMLANRSDWALADIAREIGSSGYAPETIALSIATAAQITREGIEAAMHELNEIGGDTDTVGSIAGQVAGAFLTSDGLPLHILHNVREATQILETAQRFAMVVAAA